MKRSGWRATRGGCAGYWPLGPAEAERRQAMRGRGPRGQAAVSDDGGVGGWEGRWQKRASEDTLERREEG